jgi:antitoxin ParD1/3/4
MNVSLTPELESLVQQKVNSGLYTSASEVVREALRLLNDRDTIQQQRMAELKREIAIGLDQLNRGEGIAYNEQSLRAMFDEIKQDGRKNLSHSRKDTA